MPIIYENIVKLRYNFKDTGQKNIYYTINNIGMETTMSVNIDFAARVRKTQDGYVNYLIAMCCMCDSAQLCGYTCPQI